MDDGLPATNYKENHVQTTTTDEKPKILIDLLRNERKTFCTSDSYVTTQLPEKGHEFL